jgi:hypothetical protein
MTKEFRVDESEIFISIPTFQCREFFPTGCDLLTRGYYCLSPMGLWNFAV